MSKNTYSGAILIFAACALLAVVVGASTVGTQNSNSGGTGNSNSGGAGNSNMSGHAGHNMGNMTADAKFAMMAAMGGMAEVEMGRLAAQKGASDEVRQFGQRMVDDHTRANEQLMQVASSKGMTLPTALDAKHQAEMQRLSALPADRFDREYVKMMVKDHKKDVAEFQKESTRGTDPDLKSFAATALPTLQTHLQMIQRIDDKTALRKSGNLKTTTSNTSGGTGANSNANGNSNR
jgi:putative membrane protein